MEIHNIDVFLKYYSRIKHRTRRLFDFIPEDKLEWTYQEGKFTIGDIIRHIANIERYLYAETLRANKSLYSGCGTEYADGLAQVMAYYDRMYEESVGLFSDLSEDDLNGRCITPSGHEITRWKWLRAMVEHEVHHRGQLYLYLAMSGVKTPPIFGLTSEEVIRFSNSDRD